ncbi:MAG: tRNA (adenosine(37)-N6)-threonylcarbamoyltransferase complex dimerization subunit type 1 TsaB [Bdellovibrionales bacterium]|nr:tRNA (adenosine(37)-N6)-threonylcarbamoyltransferase complex dimerization subunit type 1 TsaB [Bdellovibrionales bacterium]
MSVILAVDTSSKFSSLAIRDSNGVIHQKETLSTNSHDEDLSELTNQMLKDLSLRFSDLEYVLVGSGPGSFTGLRIGFSFLKGLAIALKIPLRVYSTFAAVAVANIEIGIPILAVADARRNEWFVQSFISNNESELLNLSELQILDTMMLASLIRETAKPTAMLCCSEKVNLNSELVDFDNSDSKSFLIENLSRVDFCKIAKGLILLDQISYSQENKESSNFELELSSASPLYLRKVAAKTIAERQASKD